MKARIATLVAVLTGLAAPTTASAVTFCVHDPADCVGTTQPSLQAAIDAAASNGNGRDRIEIGVGLFNDGPVVNLPNNPVDIVGTASNQTAIRSSSTSAGLTIMSIQEPATTISNLRVHHNSTATPATGIALAGTAEDVLVTNQFATGQFDGVQMLGTSGSFEDSSVNLVYETTADNRAIYVPAGADADVVDSFLASAVGVEASGDVLVSRTRIQAHQGVSAISGAEATVRDSAISLPGPMASTLSAGALIASGTGATTIDADRVTAVGDGSGSFGVWATPTSGAANSATIELDGSVLHGFEHARVLTETGGASVTMTTDWSAFDLGSFNVTGTPSYTAGPTMLDLVPLDPGFLNPSNRDFRPLHDSPLVDAGDPAFQPMFGWTDLAGLFRPRDGDGSGNPPVVDLGASEYQRATPVADALAEPATVGVGQATTLYAGESADVDDEPLTFAWSFDDGTAASGQLVQHAFATPGPHQATVTVTDPTGLSDTATVTITVTGGANPPTGGAGQPEIRNLRLTPRRFRAAGKAKSPRKAAVKRPPVGTTIRYRLIGATAVGYGIERKTAGRRVGGKCRKRTAANRGAKRCTRWTIVAKFSQRGLKPGEIAKRFDGRVGKRVLKPGRYRLTAVPAGGAKLTRAPFTIAPPAKP